MELGTELMEEGGGLQHPTLISMPSPETPLYSPLPNPGFCPGVHSDGSHGPAQKANLLNSWERRKGPPPKAHRFKHLNPRLATP